MAERKSNPPEGALTTFDDAEQLPYSPRDIKVEISYFLKQEPHKLPKPSVDYLLAQFTKLVKQEREDKSLQAVLMDLVIVALNNPSGANSPRYLAIVDFVRSKGYTVDEVPGKSNPPKTAVIAEQTADAVAAATGPTSDFPADEVSSSVRAKFSELMSMDPPDAVRLLFPSIPDMVLNPVVLKILQGPTPEEANDLNWHVNFFTDLVEKFPSLKQDLDRQNIPVHSAARALVARGQKEANRAAVARAERMQTRGQMATIQGIHVSELQQKIELEQAIASSRQASDASAATSESLAQDTATPAAETTAPTVEKQDDQEVSRDTVGPEEGYDATIAASQKEIATVPVDTRAVRAHLETVPQMAAFVPPKIEEEDTADDPSNRRTLAPEELTAALAAERSKKPKKGGVISALGKLFRGGKEE